MKKLLIALLALGMVSSAGAKIYKLQKLTKAQERQVEAELEEGSGDAAVFGTQEGPLWIYVDSKAMGVLKDSALGECYDIRGEFTSETAKKVKCPKGLK